MKKQVKKIKLGRGLQRMFEDVMFDSANNQTSFACESGSILSCNTDNTSKILDDEIIAKQPMSDNKSPYKDYQRYSEISNYNIKVEESGEEIGYSRCSLTHNIIKNDKIYENTLSQKVIYDLEAGQISASKSFNVTNTDSDNISLGLSEDLLSSESVIDGYTSQESSDLKFISDIISEKLSAETQISVTKDGYILKCKIKDLNPLDKLLEAL